LRRQVLQGALPVLVVEDDAVQGLDLTEMLKEAGASVIGPISSMEAAIGAVRSKACAAAIIDFRLGDFNAIPLGEELHQRQIPFVIYTGYDCLGVLPRHWQGCRVVVKPAAVGELVRTIAALVRWRQSRDGAGTGYRPYQAGLRDNC
jgi:DNA-binding NtrC family response regulator